MKRIFLITALLTTIILQAQERTERGNELKSEELANIQAKKTTLALTLNKSQQEEVYTVFLAQAKSRMAARSERKKMKATDARPTKEMKLKMANKRLDAQIEMQNQMKNILTAEQFEQWQKMKRNRKMNQKEKGRPSKKKRQRSHH